MSFKRITPEDLSGKGNLGRPDTPGVSTAEMQRILDEIPREVIVPAFNALAEQLESADAAAQLGATLPGRSGDLPEGTGHTVQDVLEALLQYSRSHRQDKQNPHGVTADQVGAYSKAETDRVISDRVQQIGSADMTKAEYGGSAPGIVKAADNADKLGGRLPADYASANSVKVFTATFRLDGWAQSGSSWTQTVSCAGMQPDCNTSPPWICKTGNQATDEALQDALSQLNDGLLQPMDGQLKATLYAPPLGCDVQIFVQRRNGAEEAGGSAEIATSQEVDEMLEDVFKP